VPRSSRCHRVPDRGTARVPGTAETAWRFRGVSVHEVPPFRAIEELFLLGLRLLVVLRLLFISPGLVSGRLVSGRLVSL